MPLVLRVSIEGDSKEGDSITAYVVALRQRIFFYFTAEFIPQPELRQTDATDAVKTVPGLSGSRRTMSIIRRRPVSRPKSHSVVREAQALVGIRMRGM